MGMLLGQVLENLAGETFAAEALLTLGNLPLLARVEAVAQQFGESASTYAAGAVRGFAEGASNEDWLALMGALERADDPGAACLQQMLVWSLRQDAHRADCGCEMHSQEGK
jgi:hypothetical protein